jgi:hypothetical protein
MLRLVPGRLARLRQDLKTALPGLVAANMRNGAALLQQSLGFLQRLLTWLMAVIVSLPLYASSERADGLVGGLHPLDRQA